MGGSGRRMGVKEGDSEGRDGREKMEEVRRERDEEERRNEDCEGRREGVTEGEGEGEGK